MRRLIVVAAVSISGLAFSGCLLEVGSVQVSANGCGPRPSPTCTLSISGGVVGTPVTGNFSGSLPFNLFGTPTLQGPVTLTDFNGSVSQTITADITPDGSIAGTYIITGGTGAYAGATGTGTVTFTGPLDVSLPWTIVEVGTFELPGSATTSSAREQTLRVRATVSEVKLCKQRGGDAPGSRRARCAELSP
jgi:hypothetical protein